MRLALLTLALLTLATTAHAQATKEVRIQCPTCNAEGVIGYVVSVGVTDGGPYDLRSRTFPVLPPDANGIIELPGVWDGLGPGTYHSVVSAHNLDTPSPLSNERVFVVPQPPVQLGNESALWALLALRGRRRSWK